MADDYMQSGVPLAQLSGGILIGMLPPAFIVKITSVVTAASAFRCAMLRKIISGGEGFYPTNFFATGWKIRPVKCTALTSSATDITASDDTGKLTAAAAGAEVYTKGDWIMLCTDEFSAMLDSMATALHAGDEFTVTKSITKTNLVTGGVDLTGVSTLDVSLVKALVQNDSNAGGGASGGIFIATNDTVPLNHQLVANGSAITASADVVADLGFRIAAGKKVTANASGSNFSGSGSVVFHLTFRRNVVGATIAAA